MGCMNNSLIGISGTFGSGKDTLATHLVKNFGYTHVSTGDLVREVATRERGSVERPVLHDVADFHRKHDGAGYFVEEALKKPQPLVITGIRSLGEAKALKAAGGLLVFVDAPIELRYERMKARLRDDETKLSLEEFAFNEEKEMCSGPTDADFNIRGIHEMADTTLENTGDVDEFIRAADRELEITSS